MVLTLLEESFHPQVNHMYCIVLDGNRLNDTYIYFFLQRLKAEKAEITRFLQKSKIQQAPKVSI